MPTPGEHKTKLREAKKQNLGIKTDTPIQTRAYALASRMRTLYRYVCDGKKKMLVLSKQIVRSGTSIGANVEAAEDR